MEDEELQFHHIAGNQMFGDTSHLPREIDNLTGRMQLAKYAVLL